MADLTPSQCPPGAYCSKAGPTTVGGTPVRRNFPGGRSGTVIQGGTQIFHRTVTTPIGDPKNPTAFKTQTYIEKNGQYVLAATTTDGGKTQTFTNEAGADLRKAFQPGGPMAKATQDSAIAQLKAGGNTGNGSVAAAPYNDNQLKQAGLKPNVASSGSNPSGQSGDSQGGAPSSGPSADESKALEEPPKILKDELSAVQTRSAYGDLKYPIKLDTNHQDFIMFTMLEYVARGLEGETTGVVSSEARLRDRKILGTVKLPIPGGISDTNSVSWQDNQMSLEESALTQLATGVITEGGKGAQESAEKAGATLQNNNADVKTAVAMKFVQAATGVNALTRKYGVVANNNLELLFSTPNLRSFTFTFRMSAREPGETDRIKRIIRFFKQGMSAKKSKGAIFLKSPNTFKIEYYVGLGDQKLHPYLNKFKECALTSCSVNYTPDGNYATFYDGSMTSYEMTLQFTELEPLFDSDYGNDYDNIGY